MPFDPNDRSNPRTQAVTRAVTELTYAPQGDIQAAQRIVMRNQNILLSEDADVFLASAINVLVKMGNPTALSRVPFLKDQQRLLRRCRQVGIDQAFAEFRREKGL